MPGDPPFPSGTITAPLAVHVLWTGEDAGADSLANGVYRYLARDPRRPLERGLGIPVRLWKDPVAEAVPALDLDSMSRAAVVPLVGAKMVLDASDALAALRERIEGSGGRHRLYPVALTPAAFRGPLAASNFIRLQSIGEATRLQPLVDALAHALYQLLADEGSGPPRLRLFLSHAKHDGREIAEALRDHLRAETQLDSFFDTNDITYGSAFAEEIERGAEGAALVAIQTDAYASREWCRREVLIAKAAGRPVIVINAVRMGELRSFPYLGNVPTIRWSPGDAVAERCASVVSLALRESLRVVHFTREVAAREIVREGDAVTAYPPELLTLAAWRRNAGGGTPAVRRVVYADPPLGDEEVAIIRAMEPALELVTPRLARHVDLTGQRVGISASASPDMARRGWAQEQLDDFLVEVARYLLASNAAVAFGGDLREGGLSEGLLELARAHDASGHADRIHLFLYWPYHRDNLAPEREAELRPEVRVHRAARPDTIPEGSTLAQVAADRSLAQASLSRMRSEMTAAVQARVFLGGKTDGYMGLVPGVLEEAAQAAAAGQPLYLVGAFGGMTGALIGALGTGPLPAGFGEEGTRLLATVRAHRATVLDNGLTVRENEELFTTTELAHAVEVTVQGIGRRLAAAAA
ncbi:TIR domain-containing protein [Longimicrobium sp.]|jgi:hypothetical protein|uniref:TIR domain-containing protein n=1 Tax=Longimicrobium sp. TaxID=2029185 RepID=UPI002F934DDC